MIASRSFRCCRPAKGSALDHGELALLLNALSHPVRLHLVRFLALKGTCVFGELAAHVGMAPSTVSQHVAVLREAGIFCAQPDGRAVCYCLDASRIDALKRSLERIT